MEREKTFSEKLIEAFDKAGIKGETTVHKVTPADRRRSRATWNFLEKLRKDQERAKKHLEKHPVYFKEKLQFA